MKIENVKLDGYATVCEKCGRRLVALSKVQLRAIAKSHGRSHRSKGKRA